MKFSKPATTIDQQIDLLLSRGMEIPDKDYAHPYLSHLSYYRLRVYWRPFEHDQDAHIFKHGARFEDAVSLYVFDRELRLLVMDAVERLEVSIRTQWAYCLAQVYGPHAYLNSKIFKNNDKYQQCLNKLADELGRSKEDFIKHYREKYTYPSLPPIWAVVEVMSLGQLSRWVSELTHGQDRQAIANNYGVDEIVLTSFLHHLTIVRNFCAHHGRLWNRRFGFVFKVPRAPDFLFRSLNHQQPKQLYNTLVFLEYLTNTISPGHHWKNRLIELLDRFPSVEPVRMGFRDDWKGLDVWTG